MNTCTITGTAPDRADNPFDRWTHASATMGETWRRLGITWDREEGGRCLQAREAIPADSEDCPPPFRWVVQLGDLVEAADLWRIPDGTVGRVVFLGEVDAFEDVVVEVVIAWTDGRSTTHAAPLRLPRATAAPEPWAAASLAAVGDRRWTLHPARRPKLEAACLSP